MTESTLGITRAEIAVEVGFFLGYGRTAGDWSASQSALIYDFVESGLAQFYNPPPLPGKENGHDWNFLKPVDQMTFTAPYETGTIEIVAGVVTLTGGTFPTWAASGDLEVNGASYEVSTRDGNTQVTLVDTTVAVSSGASYSLKRLAYDLPDAFAHMVGTMTLNPGNGTWIPVQPISEGRIREWRQSSPLESGRPIYYATRPKALTSPSSAGQRWELLPWPLSDATYVAKYQYKVLANALGSSDYPYGGAAHRETLIESCLAVAERRMENEEGVHAANFIRCLAASISHDRRTTPESLGYNGDPSMGVSRYDRESQLVTYEGVLYPD